MDDVYAFIECTSLPVVVKATEQWRLLDGRHNVKVAYTREVLIDFCKDVVFEESPMLLQEFIPGADWIYDGYCNAKTGLCLGFTGKKLMNYPPGAGAAALGVAIRNELLCSLSQRLLQAISYSGLVDIDWRQDSRDGGFKIVDCNPRTGMNFRIFENEAGIDVVRALHLDLTGRPIDRSQATEGRSLVVEPWFFLSLIRGGRAALTRETDKPKLTRRRELAWWSADDKLPFLVMSARLSLRTIGRAVQSLFG